MRIIRKEMKKLFNMKLSVILFLFTAIFIWLFLSIAQPNWNYSASPYDVDFHRELVAEFGPELKADKWDSFLKKRQELIDTFEAAIAEDTILQKNGIATYDAFLKALHSDTDLSSDEENRVSEELNRLFFNDSVTSPLLFNLQTMQKMKELKGSTFFADQTQDSVSLIHGAVTQTIDSDFPRMIVLLAIWCFIIILPYQIGERLKGVRDLQLSSKTGRKVFGRQAVACALTGLLMGNLLSAVYAALLYRKGTFDFWNCGITPYIGNHYWLDLTFGQYLLIYLAIFLLASVSAAMLAYFVGRLSANYIAGLGVSIPVAVVFCAASAKFGGMPFYADTTVSSSIIKLSLMLVLCVICLAIVIVLLKKDKLRDIL